MKVLVVGSGGREHALAWKISQSPLLEKLYCATGNAGTSSIAENIDLSASNIGALALWAVEHKIDLTVVGPEAPLADGIVNTFQEHGLRIFGPVKEASLLESSKSFAKEVLLKAGVPTAKGAVFDDFETAKQYVEAEGVPIVVKADGLAAGKGVVVARSKEEAIQALENFMLKQSLGVSGAKVVIEEALQGQEASLMGLVDGDTVLPLVVSQDYKRLLEGNTGPNTGGMGAISPTPVLSEEAVEKRISEIFLPVLRELNSRGIRYTGFLYAGVMVSPDGDASVLEFNCRLGDPETQPILMRLESDLLPALSAAVDGRLSTVELRWTKQAAACVVASSEGYPQKAETGREITGLFDGSKELMVFHAGTKLTEEGKVLTSGGRVLAVSALGRDVSSALEAAYEGLSKVHFEGMHFRKDIGQGT